MRLTRYMNNKNRQTGAVSLFIVLFAAMLLTVVTVSFSRMMVQDQQQASNQDLSQSAFDSAQAGVQDAQRAILRYAKGCALANSTICGQPLDTWKTTCNAALAGLGIPVGGEVKVQQNSEDAGLDQAYTCVKVAMDTDDVLGVLGSDAITIIPLRGKGNFDSIRLEWYTSEDLGNPKAASVAVNATNPGSLLPKGSWSKDKPSVMRVQLIQYGDQGFTMSDFDTTIGGNSNSNTLFLYPTTLPSGTAFFSDDNRPDRVLGTTSSNCRTSLAAGGYACTQRMLLPSALKVTNTRTAYLILKPLYNATHYRLQLLRGGTIVPFDGVQPSIDSTGRANDMFRRIETRVNLINANFPFPKSAIYTEGSVCKNFNVTKTASDFPVINTIDVSSNTINGCKQ